MPSKLDTIAALGGDVEALGWVFAPKWGTWYDGEDNPASDATPTEIMAAAFVLVKLLMSHGVKFEEELDGKYCVWKRRIGDSAPFDLVSTDFIEALLIAGEKLREAQKC